MALRSQLASTPCTVQDFELAAEARFWEGLTLVTSGNLSGGIYLLGYVAEMLLKNSSFRIDPSTRPSTLVEPRLAPSKVWMKIRHPLIHPESYHSLIFWLTFLRSTRRRFGKPSFSAGFEQKLIRSVRGIYFIWWVEMRYRPDLASPREAQLVYDGVVWMRDHYPLLWR